MQKISKTNGFQWCLIEKKKSFFINFFNLCLLGADLVCNKMTLPFYDGASDIFLRYFNITMVPAIFFWEISILRWCQANFFDCLTKNTIAPTGMRHGTPIYRLINRSSRSFFWFFYVKHKNPHWYALRCTQLSIDKSIVQANFFTTFLRRQDEPGWARMSQDEPRWAKMMIKVFSRPCCFPRLYGPPIF